MRKTFLFLIIISFTFLIKANSTRVSCEDCKFYHDSIYTYVSHVCESWIKKDTLKIVEFQKRFLDKNLPKSQFYYFSNMLEYLSGISFGAYEDSEEYAPSLDNDSNLHEIIRREIITDFYKIIFNNKYIFCHYPVQYKYYFDTLLSISFEKDKLDTILCKNLIESLNTDIERNNILLIGKIYPYKLGEVNVSTYYTEFSAKFVLKDKDYFSNILFRLEDRFTDDTSFFEIANALFNVIQLKFYPDSPILISDYGFVNERNNGALKKYLTFFFKIYFDSKLCFTEIPLDKRDYIYQHYYKTDYNNIDFDDELRNVINELFDLVKKK